MGRIDWDPVTREDTGLIPTIGKFKEPKGGQPWYTLVEPESRYRIDGNTGRTTSSEEYFFTIRAAVAFGIVLLTIFSIQARSLGEAIGLALAGLITGGLVGSVVGARVDVSRRARLDANDRAQKRIFGCRVTQAHGGAWRICELASTIAATDAWANSTVDAERKVPAIVWGAVKRTLITEDRYADAKKALTHDSLREVAQRTLKGVERERASLEEIRANLEAVLSTARAIDARRRQLAANLKHEQMRKAEEIQLRERLMNHSGSIADIANTEAEADRSAGLAAEVEFVADVLAKSDRLLRDDR